MLSLLRVRMLWLDVGIKIYTTDTKKKSRRNLQNNLKG